MPEDALSLTLEVVSESVKFLKPDFDAQCASNVIDCLNDFSIFMKREDQIPPEIAEILTAVIELVIQRIEYPDWCTF